MSNTTAIALEDLTPGDPQATQEAAEAASPARSPLDKKALASLLAQHSSS